MTENFIEQLKAGDSRAYSQLIDDYQSMILNICYKFLRNSDDAKDAAQEVFVQAFRSIKSFRYDAELSTWLYRIAVNRSIDALRIRKRNEKWFSFKDTFEKITVKIADYSGDSLPEKSIELKEREKYLQDALEKLPANQQKALMLSKCEGFSNIEIAEILQVSVSSVESLIHRAKSSMAKTLGKKFRQRI